MFKGELGQIRGLGCPFSGFQFEVQKVVESGIQSVLSRLDLP